MGIIKKLLNNYEINISILSLLANNEAIETICAFNIIYELDNIKIENIDIRRE